MALMTGEQVQVVRSIERRNLLPHRSPGCSGNDKFVLASLPTHWEFDFEHGEWLPGIREVALVDGVNGVGRDLNPGPIVAMIGRKGGVVIHEEDSRLPAKFHNPVRMMRNTKGRPVYYPCWVQWDVMGEDAERVPVGDDHREFRRVLRDTGVVAPISAMMKKRTIKGAIFRRDEAVNMYGASPSNAGLADKVQRAQAEVVAMDREIPLAEALAIVRGESTPAPTKRRARKDEVA